MDEPTTPPPPPPPVSMHPEHAQQLEYAYLMRRRPPIVTATGVMSIIVGLASVLACVISVMIAAGVIQFKRMAANAAAANAAMTVAMTTRVPGPLGLDARQRQVVVEALNRLQALSPQRQDRLDEFLAQEGLRALPKLPRHAQVDGVVARVADSGTAKGPEIAEPHSYFVVPEGRLEVYDGRVTFSPFDGTSPIVVRQGQPTTAPATAPATAPTTLPAADVKVVLDEVQTLTTDDPPSAAQLAALRKLLEAPGQALVLPSNANAPASIYVASAYVDEEGGAHVVFINDIVSISPDGASVTTQPTSAIPSAIGASVSNAALGLAIVEGILSGLLAVFLIVVGVLTLRDSMSARRLHWAYVAIKVPLALASIAAWAWLLYGLNKGLSTLAMLGAPTPAGFFSVLIGVTLVLGVGGLLYPISLALALRGRNANAYYNMVT